MPPASSPPAPIPMDDRLLHLAQELKTAGLGWEPAVGCFVWDPRGRIAHPSPFPNRVYFILSMQRFIDVFGDIEQMQRHLVWLPTWYQVRQVMRRLRIGEENGAPDRLSSRPSTPEEELLRLYRRILQHLTSVAATDRGGRPTTDTRTQNEWIRAVMASEVGDVDWMPKPVRERIESVYSEVAGAYLGWRRIQEGRTEDWLPRETVFDADLLGELGHFYCDYQASVKALGRIREAVRRLKAIDPSGDRDARDRLAALVLENDDPQGFQRDILERLTSAGRTDGSV